MPILSRKDLERISRRVLFRYLTLSDRKMDRIDPVDFAEKICGLHFAFADMSVTGSILGLTSYSDVDLTISVPRGNGSVQEFHLNGNIAYVDQNLANAGSVGRLNFTLVRCSSFYREKAPLFPLVPPPPIPFHGKSYADIAVHSVSERKPAAPPTGSARHIIKMPEAVRPCRSPKRRSQMHFFGYISHSSIMAIRC